MEDGIERKILEEMAERLVAKKSEISKFIQGEDINQEVINAVTKSLLQRGLLIPVYSSETTYAITQRGIKEAFRF